MGKGAFSRSPWRVIPVCRHGGVRLGLLVAGCAVVATVFLFSLGEVIAHEGEGHRESASHREAMLAVKKDIPKKFRDMKKPPVPVDEETVALGQEVYRAHCAVCHGEEGRGDGPAAAGMEVPPADFLDLDHSSFYSPGEKYWLVTHGAPETGMPGFSARLDEKERWSVVVYILALQRKVDESPSGTE